MTIDEVQESSLHGCSSLHLDNTLQVNDLEITGLILLLKLRTKILAKYNV